MIYNYTDTFIVDSVEVEELTDAETKALLALDRQNITDDFYREALCLCLVYIDLAGKQLEVEEMKDKVAYYRKEYDNYMKAYQNNGSDAEVCSYKIGRA